MFEKVHLIFSGYNQRAVVSFIRTLIINKQPYSIVACSENDPIFQTGFKENIYSVRKKNKLDLVDIKNCIVEARLKSGGREFLIAPSTEALNRFVIDNRSFFEELNCTSPLVDGNLYRSISDKHSFCELCNRNGIKIPKISQSVDAFDVPFVAKPYEYFSIGRKVFSPVIVLSEKDKRTFLEKYNSSDFFYQEFVDGKSFYLLYYFHRNGSVYKFSQENIVQQPDGKSVIAAFPSDFHLSEESARYEVLFKKLGYYGFVMVEIRNRGNVNYMIEANPRFWGPSQLFVDAGANFFEAYLNDFGEMEEIKHFDDFDKNIGYFWFGGFLESCKKGKFPVFYNRSEDEFILELDKWIRYDIYNRCDTIDIFKNEIRRNE